MNIHSIKVPQRLMIWLCAESRMTYRQGTAHLWALHEGLPPSSVEPRADGGVPARFRWEPYLGTLRDINAGEHCPPALCGYTPRLARTRLAEHTGYNRCRECGMAAETRGILPVLLYNAINRNETVRSLREEYTVWRQANP